MTAISRVVIDKVSVGLFVFCVWLCIGARVFYKAEKLTMTFGSSRTVIEKSDHPLGFAITEATMMILALACLAGTVLRVFAATRVQRKNSKI
jgi:hypothetical protein